MRSEIGQKRKHSAVRFERFSISDLDETLEKAGQMVEAEVGERRRKVMLGREEDPKAREDVSSRIPFEGEVAQHGPNNQRRILAAKGEERFSAGRTERSRRIPEHDSELTAERGDKQRGDHRGQDARLVCR